ncbi:MAG: GGDEF domain-containing protein [Olsenella sp.]|nr:GGDEF domain-containing protein [Olsenella sp.]
MTAYYTAITVLCLMSLCTLSVLVWENNRMESADKRLLYLTYALIALSTLAEWLGGWCDGRADLPAWALPAAKCVDYIVKPMAGGALVAQMRLRNRWRGALMGILAANVVVQVVALLKGWMVVANAGSHYEHGILYPAYLTACIAVVVLVTVEAILYGRAFSRQNRLSLAVVMLFVLAGIAMQALLPMRPKAVCVAMTMGASLMYIRSVEFSSLMMDERLAAQREQIDTDPLTGVLSRHAYTQELAALDAAGPLPEDLVVFVADINGLKWTNDSIGHEAGDEMIIGAARCLEAAFGSASRIYRTGGDEFVVMHNMSRDEIGRVRKRVKQETQGWTGSLVQGVTLSCGHALAADCTNMTAEALVREADLAMYDAKAAYYQSAGRDRRHRQA